MNDLVADYAALEQILNKIAASDSTACDDETVAELAIRHEHTIRRMESIGNQRILEVSDRDAHRTVGCVTVTEFLQTKLRITHPKKRLDAVRSLEPMHAMTGEKLPPVCPNTARELAAGTIGPDHVHAVLDVLKKIPSAGDVEQRARAEEVLAEFATTLTPREITAAGVRILAHLDPDGQLTDDRDRARNRKLNLGCQDSQLMSKLTATLDPITRALFDVVLTKWAAPGMNNPDDDLSPKGDHDDADPELLREAADRDCRSQSQRNHDAFKTLLDAAVNGGLLGGSHRGLPPQIIVSITDAQLREHAGVARTATGIDLPISDVVKLAAEAQPHLAVFSDVTNEPLFFGRSQRLASQVQRFMAFTQYGGCSKDDCTTPFATPKCITPNAIGPTADTPTRHTWLPPVVDTIEPSDPNRISGARRRSPTAPTRAATGGVVTPTHPTRFAPTTCTGSTNCCNDIPERSIHRAPSGVNRRRLGASTSPGPGLRCTSLPHSWLRSTTADCAESRRRVCAVRL
ncbi:DUF222 domain-containing protein [Williamsia herbipolensis]|uniref:DUF222 domain-containing protein n=1 Tax=Williamsia herbipolensis TaxID=1603258 RepID=UPI000695F024|nr:DUF222 domain-containing protein [Williamsia herbipolensis]